MLAPWQCLTLFLNAVLGIRCFKAFFSCTHSLPTEQQDSGPYYLTSGVLVLDQASASDSGTYTCTGSNAHGSVSVSTVLEISVPGGGLRTCCVAWLDALN